MSYQTNKTRIINVLTGTKFTPQFNETVTPHTVEVYGQTTQLGVFLLIPATDLVNHVADLLDPAGA